MCIITKDILIVMIAQFLQSSRDVKIYHQFCMIKWLKATNTSLTRVACSISTLIDHILTGVPSRVSQKGVTNVGVFDHQLICFTKKISKIKTGGAISI